MLRRGEHNIRLPKLSFDLLVCLVRHAPGIVSTDQLLNEVWGQVVVGEETVKQRVSLLRQSLADDKDNPVYIESVRGVGYRLVASVADVSPDTNVKRTGPWMVLAAIGVAFAVVSLWMFSGVQDPADVRGQWSVAVLPFDDMSADSNQAYFSDGVHEEVITQLSKIERLAVTSRTSVLPYRNSDSNIRSIASDLGVNLVVEGSVRYADNRVRITVQLIDAIADQHLWAENYDRPLSVGDLFEIQGDVAQKIAEALRTKLPGNDDANGRQLPTTNLEAYDSYLLGRFHLWRGNAADLERSIEYFEAAVAADGTFAEAKLGLGQALTFAGTVYGWMPPTEAFPQAMILAEEALRLRPGLYSAYSLLGDIHTWYGWQWNAAEQAYIEASLAGDEDGSLGYMLLLSVLNRHEDAIDLTEQMIERYPRDHWVRSNAAWRFLAANQPARAESEASTALEIDNQYGDAFSSRGWARLALGNIQGAIEDFESNLSIQDRSAASLASLAIAKSRSGNRTSAESLLDEMISGSHQKFVPPEEIARVHAELGNIDSAFEFLEQAYVARSRGLIFLHANQSWDPLRSDPRFSDLLQRMNLDNR